MNVIHRRCCRSSWWRQRVDQLLPWATEDVPLAGADVLEIGSGPGLTTDWLVPRVGTLTAVEIDPEDAALLAQRQPGVRVLLGDATTMPVPDRSADVVVCFTMLHHLPSAAAQDQLFSEVARVLRPGGTFAGSDSRWGPLFALAHIGDTMTLINPATLADRLAAAGLAGRPVCERGRHALRFRATSPAG